MDPVRFCAIMQPRMACAARKVERGSCKVAPFILMLIPATIGPSNNAAGRCKARNSTERRIDNKNNKLHCKTGIPCSPQLPLIYRYSIKKARLRKNISNQENLKNSKIVEKSAPPGGKGQYRRSVVVNFKQHHGVKGAGLNRCSCNRGQFCCISLLINEHIAGEVGIFRIFVKGIGRGVFIQ